MIRNPTVEKPILRIVVEMVEAMGDFAITKIVELANQIYQTGKIPEKTKESEFIVILKKEGVIDCSKYRTIPNMSQVAKIVLKVIDERLISCIVCNEEIFTLRKDYSNSVGVHLIIISYLLFVLHIKNKPL